jgi:hypothetical protein
MGNGGCKRKHNKSQIPVGSGGYQVSIIQKVVISAIKVSLWRQIKSVAPT